MTDVVYVRHGSWTEHTPGPPVAFDEVVVVATVPRESIKPSGVEVEPGDVDVTVEPQLWFDSPAPVTVPLTAPTVPLNVGTTVLLGVAERSHACSEIVHESAPKTEEEPKPML
ncbi:MAG: hypothetical protein ACYDFT_04595 [Thermoplasmata archaeon]